MKVYIASRNAGKIRELKAIFAKSPLRLSTYRKYADVLEVAGSYAGNALLKAQTLATALRDARISAAVLADDSGLEIDALGGRPGVYSARFGGPELEWPQRRLALLEELRGIPPYRRTARFVCALAFVEPNREAIIATTATPAVQEKLKELGYVLVAQERRSTEYLRKFVESEVEKWAGVIKAANIKPE